MAYAIWRTLRRPFRYPRCEPGKCQWEVFDCDEAGCMRCGAHHHCASNAVDSRCPLAQNDDLSRVCTITGQILPEVRHAPEEFLDTCAAAPGRGEGYDPLAAVCDLEDEVQRVVEGLLLGPKARRYREEENARQARKVSVGLHKALRQAKLKGLTCPPSVCRFLAEVIGQERNLRFVASASGDLCRQCVRQIVVCLVELRGKGVKFAPGPRLEGLVCGLLYLLRTGLTYRNHVLLMPIEEIAGCLPYENKLEAYFGISSKAICETENEMKLVFRAHYQRAS